MKNKPRIHITVNTVRALPTSPPNKKLFDWDDEVRGFGCYRTSGGDVVFVYQYRLPHQPARRATIGEFGDLTPTQARDIARGWAVERRNGKDPMEERRLKAEERRAARDLRFATYVDAYIRRREIEGWPLNRQHARILVNDVAGLMPDVRIDRLTTPEIDRWQEDLQKRSKSARIYGLVYLKVVLNDAKSRGLIANSPADSYKVPPRIERERVLSIDELIRLLEALHDMADMHADMLECLLRTMRRKEEVAAMSWKEIDQRTWTWTIPAERGVAGRQRTAAAGQVRDEAAQARAQEGLDPQGQAAARGGGAVQDEAGLNPAIDHVPGGVPKIVGRCATRRLIG